MRTIFLYLFTCAFWIVGTLPASAQSSGQGEPSHDPQPSLLSEPKKSDYEQKLNEALDSTPKPPTKWGISLVGRSSLVRETDAADEFADYDELFDDGFGASLEIYRDFMESSKVRIGPYASVGLDQFEGAEHTASDNVVGVLTVDAEDMDVWTGLVGVQAESDNADKEAWFYWGVKAGAGFAAYEEVEANLNFVTANQRFFNEPFYDSTFTWAVEASARVGYGARSWAAFVGIGFRAHGSPDDGDRLDTDAGTLMTVPVEFGVEYRF